MANPYWFKRWCAPSCGLVNVANCACVANERHRPCYPKKSKVMTWPTPYLLTWTFFSQCSLVFLFSSVYLHCCFFVVVGQCPSYPKKVKWWLDPPLIHFLGWFFPCSLLCWFFQCMFFFSLWKCPRSLICRCHGLLDHLFVPIFAEMVVSQLWS